MIYIILLMVFVTMYLMVYALLSKGYKKKNAINLRLNGITQNSQVNKEDDLNQPIFVRFIKPLADDIGKIIMKITPKEIIKIYEKKIILAGYPFKLVVKDWMNIIVIISLILPVAIAIICYFFKIPLKNSAFIIFVFVCSGYVVPNMILNSSIKKRQKVIINSLPDVIDLLTVSVEAGLGFDSALSKVTEKVPGPLAEEFLQVINEIKVGKKKRDSLKSMADRIGVKDLSTFISSIIQADQLGVSIGKVLRIQSEQMRQKRRQRAQEKAMKAPVKMLIPMVMFIFPTIFAVLLGPVVVRLYTTFMK